MAFKDILVHVDASAAGRRRVVAATALAAAQEAHLVGLYVTEAPELPDFIVAGLGRDWLETVETRAREAEAVAEAAFTETVGKRDIKAEWRAVQGPALDALATHARYADLVVAGQRGAEEGEIPAPDGVPERLVLTGGRPVLVVPYAGTFETIGRRVMVAWDASSLAARAIHDALPFMKRAEKVTVMSINPKSGRFGDMAGAAVCRHLARHGVRAEAQDAYAEDRDEAETLLSLAADEGIDLLVAGAYGHSRWGDLVLGGVTGRVLETMTMPVLMSH